MFTFNNEYQPTDSKYCIDITRGIGQAELFDQMPSLGEDLWVTLLCHGGSRIDEVVVNVVNDWRTRTRPPLTACRWYPRTLLKTLLLVRTILAHIFPYYFIPTNVSLHF